MKGSQDHVPPLLFHRSVNDGASPTILLIHGAFVDANDWDLVVPHIPNYHLLLPDCPGHGRSAHLSFSVENSASQIARLIEAKGTRGQAHVVGHSLGAHVAIRLAEKYPHVVRTVFVSGYEVYPRSAVASALPHALWTMNRAERVVPQPLVRWLMDGTAIRRGPPPPLSLCSEVARALSTTAWPEPWPARTLIVAAGKGGIIPSFDHPQDSRTLAEIGKKGNFATCAYTHPLMRHPWNRQDPVLWATMTTAWVEETGLPVGFQEL